MRNTRDLISTAAVRGLVGFICLLALGCGGGDGLDTTPVTSSSFSPFTATRPDGSPAALLWWRYLVNGGEPVTGNLDGISISVPFDDLLLTVDTRSQRRSAGLSGPISGSVDGFEVSGSYATTSEQSLEIGEPTSFLDERLRAEIRISAAGESAAITADLTATYSPPVPWFLDSSDLDSLPQGFSETVGFSGDVTGTVTVSATGFPTETTPVDERVTGSETWTIAQQMPAMSVLGTEYRDVVRVERLTTALDPLTGEPTPTTIVYWVARGIGMIRVEDAMGFLDEPVVWELIATNLVQAGDAGDAIDDGGGGAE